MRDYYVIINTVLTSLLPIIIKLLYENVKIYRSVNDLVIKETQIVLYTMYKNITQHEGISKEEFIEWETIYNKYKEIGGNSFVDELNERVHSMEVM